MTIQEQLDWLIENTTVLWVERYADQSVVPGSKVDTDRFLFDQGVPVSFSQVLEPFWQARFERFGIVWSIERQKYRLLYEAMKSFFTSFIGLRLNKVSSINARENVQENLVLGDFAGSYLLQMYMAGKRTLDLMRELQIPVSTDFVKRFIETRNKLFEHNHNPRANHLPNLILEPSIWEVISTTSQMTINIHTTNEHEYEAFIDYYQDYYDLERIFVEAVKNFS